jgi:UDP-glucose 4-epimerase
MRATVIGSEGYLGAHLVRDLLRDGFDVQRLDVLPQERYSSAAPYARLDIADRDSVVSSLDVDVDFILLFAGLTGTGASFDRYQDFVQVNQLGVLNVLDHLRNTGSGAKVVFPSTRLVYRGSDSPLCEDAPQETKTLYAATKLYAENSLAAYRNAFDIDYTVFRICVPYGNDLGTSMSYGTLGFFLDAARAGKAIQLFGDGSLRRTFTHVADIASLIVTVMQDSRSSGKVLNIGGEAMELRQVADLIAKKFQTHINYSDWPELARKIESGDTVFDDTALRQLIPCDYRHHLAGWIDELR